MFTDREFVEGIILIEGDEKYEAISKLEDNRMSDFIDNYLRAPMYIPIMFIPPAILLNVGFRILVLILCFAATYPNNGKRSLVLVLPTLMYCLCTMPLLASIGMQRIFHLF